MSKNPVRWLLTMLALLTIAILISLTSQVVANVSGSTLDSFVSPVVTPIISPTPMPPTSQLTELALKHISDRVGIPVEQLILSNAYRRDYPSLGRSFWAVTALDARGSDWYKVMVDLADGSIIDRIEDIEQAAQQAQQARYGKLEPALFDRLQTMQPNDEVMVAIWVAGKPRRSREELYAALAAKYPEAKAALERSGKPFDVGDPQLGNALEAEYTRMVEEDEAALTQPLINMLRGRGYDVETLRAMPVVAAQLPKSIILEMATWTEVQKIYLDEDKAKPALDSAVPTPPFRGSVIINSTQPIVVSSNLLNYCGGSDTVSYTGLNR